MCESLSVDMCCNGCNAVPCWSLCEPFDKLTTKFLSFVIVSGGYDVVDNAAPFRYSL